MRKFEITKKIYIKCETYETRYSWGHKAWLYIDGSEVDYRKITYYNRTWEAYEFESILSYLVEGTKALTKRQKALAKKLIKNNFRVEDEKRVSKEFGMIANIAKIGALFTTDQKELNDWKERMLRAGLSSQGLSFPEDWGQLSETEKEARLNGVLSVISK